MLFRSEDRTELEQLSRSRTLPHREAQRAAIILGYYGGESIASIGRRLGMTRLSVSKWVAKALAVGPMAALKDSYHRPKEPVIGDDAKAWVVHCQCRYKTPAILPTLPIRAAVNLGGDAVSTLQ